MNSVDTKRDTGSHVLIQVISGKFPSVDLTPILHHFLVPQFYPLIPLLNLHLTPSRLLIYLVCTYPVRNFLILST